MIYKSSPSRTYVALCSSSFGHYYSRVFHLPEKTRGDWHNNEEVAINNTIDEAKWYYANVLDFESFIERVLPFEGYFDVKAAADSPNPEDRIRNVVDVGWGNSLEKTKAQLRALTLRIELPNFIEGERLIARTNEEGPPIECTFVAHQDVGRSKLPICKKPGLYENGEQFVMMGPLIKYDETLFKVLSGMSGIDGYRLIEARILELKSKTPQVEG